MKQRFFFLFLFAFLLLINLSGQKNNKKIIITGSVTDINNKPIPEVAILVDDKNTNKFTDAEGHFKVKVKPDAQMISIHLISGQSTGALINGQTVINLSLPVDISKALYIENSRGEEEINVGYGTVKRKNLTQPVGKIDGSNRKYASYSSIYEMIRGEVPGVQVQGRSITIQGINSLNLSTEPLFVVDGIVVSSIDDIQPYLVKSIEVLKGSSASIYGSRGGNGVILITLFRADNLK